MSSTVSIAVKDVLSKKWARRIIVLIVVVLSILVAWRIGSSIGNEKELHKRIDDAGAWAPVFFVILMILIVPIGVPPILFVLTAIVVWPSPLAFLLIMAGAMGKSAINFHFARTLGRATLEKRMPKRLRKWDQKLAGDRIWPVVAFRLMTYLARWADWLLGISSVKPRTFYVGTFLGILPPTIMWVLLADTLKGWGFG